ncbi:MAG: hypothetical protein K9F92_03220, partial [Candidatus Nanopelagicaceae bacterium]|nr:hypothetical protein [Candidatus Nanopelagicaceae bacterium]
ADGDRQDPTFFRTNGETKGRDGARVPMPWTATTTPFGFTSGKPWLPLPSNWRELSVESQLKNENGTLNLYRKALAIRSQVLIGKSEFAWNIDGLSSGVLGFSRGDFHVLLNTGNQAVNAQASSLILASNLDTTLQNGEIELKAGRAIWFKR